MAEQVGKFLTELPELETPTDGDLMYIVDAEASANSASKKITMSNLKRVLSGNVTGTVEGASVSFSDGADGIPMKECEVTIVPTQDLHGYSKPWAGGAGKNKLDLASDYTLTCYGGQTTTHTIKDGVNVKGGVEYTISCKQTTALSSATRFTLVIMNINSTSIYEADATNPTLTPHTHSITFTPDSDQSVSFKFWSAMPSDDIVLSDFMLEVGSQATTYEPYSNICPISGHTDVTVTVASTSGGSGVDTTVSLGRTVYGGTLDVTTGVLTVTHAIVNLGSLSWTRTTDYTNPIFYAQITDKMNSSIDSICEWYANGGLITGPTTINALQNGYFGCGNNSKYIYIRDDQYTSVSDFTSATATVKFYYELATPQTFNLTPTQVLTLLGQNYVSHDGGGNIKVVYIRDLDITINDLIDRVTALENE